MYKGLVAKWGNENAVKAIEELGLERFFNLMPRAKWFNKQLSPTFTNYAQVLELSFSLRNSDTKINEYLEVWLVPDHWREITVEGLSGWDLWKAKNVDVDGRVVCTLKTNDSYVVVRSQNYLDYHFAYRIYIPR